MLKYNIKKYTVQMISNFFMYQVCKHKSVWIYTLEYRVLSIFYSKKQISENGSISILRWQDREASTQLGPLELI
jgi:hypothetical protein